MAKLIDKINNCYRNNVAIITIVVIAVIVIFSSFNQNGPLFGIRNTQTLHWLSCH